MEGVRDRRARVLAADHDKDALALVTSQLERAGYEVLAARDGAEALVRAQLERPQLCVLDALLPKLSGYDVARLLRADPRTSAIRVILLTALSTGFDSAADTYIRKPFTTRELRSRVGALLAGREPAVSA